MIRSTDNGHKDQLAANTAKKEVPETLESNPLQSLYEYLNSFSPKMNFDFSINRMQEVSSEISRQVSDYIKTSKLQMSISENRQLAELAVNSIKTAIAKRLQMRKFFNDMDVGLSLSVAIDRLQQINDMIQEAVLLPADDESDNEIGEETERDVNSGNSTEPVGVDKIVQTGNPFITDIVRPPEEPGTVRSSSRVFKRVLPNDTNDNLTSQESDLDYVDGLSNDQVKKLTDLETLNDFCNEKLLRTKIQNIQKLEGTSQSTKNKLVTRLMMGNYYKYANEKLSSQNISISPEIKKKKLFIPQDNTSIPEEALQRGVSKKTQENEENLNEGEVILTEEDQRPSYHDGPFNTIMGCSHYQRNCKLECPICFRWYPCRFCHDSEVKSHRLVRSEVKHVLCMKCNVPQVPDTNYCTNCKQELAEYFCLKCKLYDNDTTKDIYHCDKCGICRLGLGLDKDFFHCDICNICLSIDLKEKHKCVSNTAHCNCPICNEYLFVSMSKVVFMSCGHLIHQACYDEMIKHSFRCPLCKKTIANMDAQFRILDQEISQLPMPTPYNMWKIIVSCNDCKGKSIVPYHILGLKCRYCNSFNTNNLKLIKPETEIEGDIDEQEEEGHASHAMRLVPTNLHANFHIDVPAEEDFISDDIGERSDSENLEDEGEDRQNILSLRGLTHSISNNLPSSRNGFNILSEPNNTSIVALLQNFVNNSISSKPSDS